MHCSACNKSIPKSSMFCNYCGQVVSDNFSLHAIPDDFAYDEISGWYHKIELKRDKTGKLAQKITYFNPEENWYLTELPLDHPSYNKRVEDNTEVNAPIGVVSEYLYDEIQNLYYLTDVQVDSKRKEIVQRVSYYNPKEKTFQNINYLILDVSPQVEAVPIAGSTVETKDSSIPEQAEAPDAAIEITKEIPEKNRKSKKERKKTVQRLRIIAGVLAAISLVLGIYYTLVFAGVVPRGTLENSVTNRFASISDGVKQLFTKKQTVWPDFPHTSIMYKGAYQDEENLFFLAETAKNQVALFEFSTKNKTNKILVESPDSENSIQSFTITPTYYYYSIAKENDIEAKYYRINRESNEFQFLFVADNSALAAVEEEVYLILSSNNMLRKIHGKTTSPNDFTDIQIPNVNENAYVMANAFSVHNGTLYYSELQEKQYRYYSFALDTRESQELLASLTSEQKVINPFWIGNTSYYTVVTEDEKSYQLYKEDKNPVLLLEIPNTSKIDPTKHFAVWSSDQGVYNNLDGAYVGEEKITEELATALSREWLIFGHSIYNLKEEKTYALDQQQATAAIPAPEEYLQGEVAQDSLLLAAALATLEADKPVVPAVELVTGIAYLFEELGSGNRYQNDGVINNQKMSNLLWEAYGLDFQQFEDLVRLGKIPGFLYEADNNRIVQHKEWTPQDYKIIEISAAKQKGEEQYFQQITLMKDGVSATVTICFTRNAIYGDSRYRLVEGQVEN